MFRELFEGSEDPEVRKAALAALGNDPESAEMLKDVVLDESENFKVREAGALSLHHLDPNTMNDLAAKIIAEPEREAGMAMFSSSEPDSDEVDFKAGLLNMLAFTGNANRLKENEGLKGNLKKLTDTRAEGRSSFGASIASSEEGPDGNGADNRLSTAEQMAAKLLKKLE